MKRSTLFMIILGIAIIGLTVWAYFSGQLPAPLPRYHKTPKQTVAPPPTANPALNTKVGQPFAYGSVLYTISEPTRPQDIRQSGTTLKPAGAFVQIDVTVSSLASTPEMLQMTDFTLIDSSGKQYSLNQTATKLASQAVGKTDLFAEELQPGLNRPGVLIFDVPTAATGFSLQIAGGFVDVNFAR